MQTQQPPASSPLKFIERRKNEWRCLFCCHVRTGTIFLGLWHLMLQLLALSTLAVFMQHPELAKAVQVRRTIVEPDELPTALAERTMPVLSMNAVSSEDSAFSSYDQDDMIESSTGVKNGQYYATFGMIFGRPLRYEELHLAGFFILCALIITISMLYGAIKGKPKLLIPFFCVQLFDLFITMLSALGYLCYLPDFHNLTIRTESEYMPNTITSINPQYIISIIIFTFTISILFKGYFVAVVWSCYKYLTLKRASAQPTIHYIESNFLVQNLLRPDYDFNVKKFTPPPPSYAAAVGEDSVATATHPDAPPPVYNPN